MHSINILADVMIRRNAIEKSSVLSNVVITFRAGRDSKVTF